MKYIEKNPEPVEFTVWKEKSSDDGWSPSWENFQKPEKDIVKESLLIEQGFICCYCGVKLERIADLSIEHIEPRSLSAKDLDYHNLLASCKNTNCCNLFRGNKDLPISPLDPDCEKYFRFSKEGEIFPLGELEKSKRTIESLNLNSKHLREERKATLESILNFLSDSQEFTSDLCNIYRNKNKKLNFQKTGTDSIALLDAFEEYCFVVYRYLEEQFL